MQNLDPKGITVTLGLESLPVESEKRAIDLTGKTANLLRVGGLDDMSTAGSIGKVRQSLMIKHIPLG